MPNPATGESSSENVITNVTEPTKDEIVRRVQSRINQATRRIRLNIERAETTASRLRTHRNNGRTNQNPMIQELIRQGTDYLTKVNVANSDLELETDLITGIYARITIKFPDHEEKCKELQAKADADLKKHNKLADNCSNNLFDLFSPALGQAPAPSSRSNSPSRSSLVYIKSDHMLPPVLTESCTTSEYRKFKRDFDTWILAAFPDGRTAVSYTHLRAHET